MPSTLFIGSWILSCLTWFAPGDALLPDDARAQAWSDDLLHLVEELERMHPDLYFGVPREEFEESVGSLFDRIPDLSDDQMIVELMKLTGLLSRSGREGHSGLFPTRMYHSLPIQVAEFEDGWFVVDAAGDQQQLVGARLLGVGGHDMQEVLASLAPLVTFDCEINRRM